MAIEELVAVVPPPARPKEAGDRNAWRVIESRLGTALPADYRDFVETYGSGCFNDPGRLCVSVWNPFGPIYQQQFSLNCANLRLVQSSVSEDEWPYKVFPESPGLLPWGRDDNGSMLLWLTKAQPNCWPILLHPPRSTDFERIELPMTSFLAKAFSRQLPCSIWSSPEFFSGPRRVKFAQEERDIEYQ